jgi:CDP-diacylglycerol---serine O-phosphatidyltransferase
MQSVDNPGETSARDWERRMVPKPGWVVAFEGAVASKVPLHPNIISSIKLLVVIPMLIMGLRQTGVLPLEPWAATALFAAFAFLDWLDGVVARVNKQQTWFGGVFDRATDYPMLFTLSVLCLDLVPTSLLAAKLVLELVLFAQFLAKMGGTENRIRTTLTYATLLALLFLSQGWAPRFVTPRLVEALLILGIAFTATVVLYNARLLRKHWLADALSGVNLLCGIFSMIFAYRGRVDISILFLLLGAMCDGFDGAAARKFGGTAWGVYSDDVADAVNYGVAPGVAVFFVVGGLEGAVAGALYIVFTLTRLVFFTLNKGDSDPNYFAGVPSTVGALVALTSLMLLADYPVALGLMIGVSIVLMVSFDAQYRHLGRAMAAGRRYIFGATALALAIVGAGVLWGPRAGAWLILATSLAYGFVPVVSRFRGVLSK